MSPNVHLQSPKTKDYVEVPVARMIKVNALPKRSVVLLAELASELSLQLRRTMELPMLGQPAESRIDSATIRTLESRRLFDPRDYRRRLDFRPSAGCDQRLTLSLANATISAHSGIHWQIQVVREWRELRSE